ncbi:MAG: hypothetical protein ACOVT5_09265, partial [Armatimonadaceae bacterium]
YNGTQEDIGLIPTRVSLGAPSSIDLQQWMPTGNVPERTIRSAWRSLVDPTLSGESREVVRTVRDKDLGIGLISRDATGKQTRHEWMVDLPTGRHLRQTGVGVEQLRLDPPLLMLPRVIERGRSIAWRGTVETRSGRIPGRGWTRFRGWEAVKLEGKPTQAICIESVVVAESDIGTVRLPTTRWFIRNYGQVRVWFQLGSTEYLREVTDLEFAG